MNRMLVIALVFCGLAFIGYQAADTGLDNQSSNDRPTKTPNTVSMYDDAETLQPSREKGLITANENEMIEDSGVWIHNKMPGKDYSVVVEDDDRVAYAYLLHGREIVADVWLYNRNEAPAEPEWTDQSKAPFANPKSLALENDKDPVLKEEDVAVSWEQEPIAATIKIHGLRWAVLRPGSKPGWCRLAKKPGPLALPLHEQDR